jgi:hypothetical protein
MFNWKLQNKKQKYMSEQKILGIEKSNPIATFLILGLVIGGGYLLVGRSQNTAAMPTKGITEAAKETKCQEYTTCEPNQLFELRESLKSEKAKNVKAKEDLEAENKKATTNIENLDAQLTKVDEAINAKMK